MTSTPEPASDPYGPRAGPDEGQVKTIAELFTDWYSRQASYVCGASHDGPGRDWQMIRAAEASARETGMRASIPDQSAAGTPEYAADLAQWGDGRGIGPGRARAPEEPAGPEAGE
jgi:hypothetical protein